MRPVYPTTYSLAKIAVLAICASTVTLTASPGLSNPGKASGPLEKVHTSTLPPKVRTKTPKDGLAPLPLISLEPYSQVEPKLEQINKALERGQCGRALKEAQALDVACAKESCGYRAPLLWALSEAEWCSGARKEGLERLQALEKTGYPGYEPELYARLERWSKVLGKPAPSRVQPSLANEPSRWFQSELRVLKRLGKAGKYEAAHKKLQELRNVARARATRRAVTEAEASLLQMEGRKADAGALYLRLWHEASGRREAMNAFEQLLAFEKATGITATSFNDHLDHLLLKVQSKKATKVRRRRRRKRRRRRRRRKTSRLAKVNRQLVGQIWKKGGFKASERQALDLLIEGVRAIALKKHDKGLAKLRQAEAKTKNPVLVARILSFQGLALRKEDRDAEATTVFARVVADYPNDRAAIDAAYEAGRLSILVGKPSDAVKHLTPILSKTNHHPKWHEIRWQAGWGAFLSGDFGLAEKLLTELADNAGDRLDRSDQPIAPKAHYWRARAMQSSGQQEHAVDGYRRLVETYPGTYYAGLAYRRIESMGVSPRSLLLGQPAHSEVPRDLAKPEGVIPGHERVRRGLELWRRGRKDAAKDALAEQLRFKGAPRGVVELLAMFHLMDGDVAKSHWVAGYYGEFSTTPFEGNLRLWGLAYPQPRKFAPIADKWGAKLSVDPLLAMAIMRHESAFKPEAVSPVGALGLMQLMPASGRAINKMVFGQKGPSIGRLRQPKHNIRLGMAMLRVLDERFQGNLPLMIAGYNAGSGVGDRWHARFKGVETDALVELMTYPKTKAYVRNVLGSYYAYRMLYGDGTPPPIDFELPEKLGSWGGSKMRLSMKLGKDK